MKACCILSMVVVTAVFAPVLAMDEGDLISLAQRDFIANRNAPTSPDLLSDAGEPIMALQATDGAGRPCKTVFGYLPYWESAANIRYDLLTHLACFSVEVNSNGTIGNTHGWPWTSIINEAHANGVKVILVATNFSSSGLYTLVTTPAYKNAFFANIKAKILEGNADGVNIDFEGTGTWRSYINSFMAELTAYLHAEIPGCEVTFAGPAVNWSSAWDLEGLAASCDGIFIMGYAFWGSWSTTSGPNAPLIGGSINITDTVVDEYYPVTQNNPEKLILGVPYYGGHWITTSSTARSSVVSWVGSTRFYNDEPDSQSYGLLWDSASQTPWYRWYTGGQWHQVWFDNAESLGMKYQLANDYNLQGVGMWALNYDGTRDELWDTLDLHFRAPCLVPTITAQPVAQNVCPGDAAVFSVTAEGDAPLSYQWQKDEVDLVEGGHYTGVQTPTLTVSNAAASDVAAYRCVVSIESAAAFSDSAPLSLKTATAITGQPDSQAVLWGGTAQFSVIATGEGALSYQWQKDLADLVEGGHYSGVNSPMLTIAGANADDAAEYRCVVTAGCGNAASNAATLTVAAMGDFDGDSDVDMADFGTFSFCFNGPNRPLPSPGCYVVDFDEDSDVDLTDFSAFQACFNGPNRTPACAG